MDSTKTTRPLLFAIVILLSVAALYLAKQVVIVLLLALMLVYTVDPLVVLLQRRRIPFWLSTLIAIAFFACLFLGLFLLMLRDFTQFAKTFTRFQQAIVERAGRMEAALERSLGVTFPVNPLEDLSRLPIGAIGLSFVRSAFGILSQFLLIFFFAIILLIGKYRAIRKILTVFPRRHSLVPVILRDIDQNLRAFLGIKAFFSLVIGLATAAVLLGFRVEFAITWGLLTVPANFVPTLGPITAILIPVVISSVQTGGLVVPLEVAACLTGVHLIVSSVVEPRLMGERLDLSFFVIFVSLFFWGWMWGTPGVLLAVPVTASIKIVLERVPATAGIALLLGRDRKSGRGQATRTRSSTASTPRA